jgi:hypothetical protein
MRLIHAKISGLPDVSPGFGLATFHGFSNTPATSGFCSATSYFKLIPQGFSSGLLACIKTSPRIQTSVTNLDRIRVFRRRQDSPSLGPDEREPRERSPGWFQRMHRNMSSSKRSRSSSTQPETPSEVDRPEPPEPTAARDNKSDGLPKMPAFLLQSPSGRS